MKALIDITPTSEQLPIIASAGNGVTIIRGAAGSGKTTTALLILKQLSTMWNNRKKRKEDETPVNILVLTFNRTLRGYILQLAEEHIPQELNISIKVSTFSKWAVKTLGVTNILQQKEKEKLIRKLGKSLPLDEDFLINEVEYCLSRFSINSINEYIDTIREGRGNSPKVDKHLRMRLISEVILPYDQYKKESNLLDWNDLAIILSLNPPAEVYDVIIVDETQDFSANQIRAIAHHKAEISTLVFVLDTAQRIYPHAWSWKEVNIEVNSNRSFFLTNNYRNTKNICNLAKPLLAGISIGNDGSLPNLDSCAHDGRKPEVLIGRYLDQCEYALRYIKEHVDLLNETVAFIHPKAGGWFSHLQTRLEESDLPYILLTRSQEWPDGNENIALISMHSVKGLEFDHVIILGLNKELTPFMKDEDSDSENFRRLLSMSITRAKKMVILGYKAQDKPPYLDILGTNTYKEIIL